MSDEFTKVSFRKAWPTLKHLAEEKGYGIAEAKRKACEMHGIPYDLEQGFQKLPEYRRWRRILLSRRSGAKRWIHSSEYY